MTLLQIFLWHSASKPKDLWDLSPCNPSYISPPVKDVSSEFSQNAFLISMARCVYIYVFIQHMQTKLMRCTELWARFHYESVPNHRLIDILDLNQASDIIEIIATIQIWTRTSNLNSNLIKNLSNFIKILSKTTLFWLFCCYFWCISSFSIDFNNFDCLIKKIYLLINI